jgi:hypothetical protein
MKGCPYFLEASLKVEDNLRSGVVATSSLDLGVDFSSVDAVIQIGNTRGIARLLQRAGLSNHRPGETERILCTDALVLSLPKSRPRGERWRMVPSNRGPRCGRSRRASATFENTRTRGGFAPMRL